MVTQDSTWHVSETGDSYVTDCQLRNEYREAVAAAERRPGVQIESRIVNALIPMLTAKLASQRLDQNPVLQGLHESCEVLRQPQNQLRYDDRGDYHEQLDVTGRC